MKENDQETIRKSVAQENEQSAAGGGQKFDFITETIKKKPVNKKRVFLKLCSTIFSAVVFGLVACLTFIFLLPRLQARFGLQNAQSQTVVEDTDDGGETESVSTEDVDVTPATEEKPHEVVTQVVQKVEKVEKNLDVSDYKQLYTQISRLGYEVRKSLVTVTGVYPDTDWFQNPYELNRATSGLIVTDNGKELLIIAQTEAIKNAESVIVTFSDGSEHKASIKKNDTNTGLTVVGVELDSLSDETKEKVARAKLGSSRITSLVGTPIIALGNPIGISGSMASGQITSNSFVKTLTDSSVQFLTTDIYGSAAASGVLVNLDGEVLGIIYQDENVGDTPNLIKAYGISDLKGKIEKLSNGQDLAYLGIYGTDVTEAVAEELGLPLGAYVKEVVIDSPAMQAGIQNGDVIVKIGTTEINSFEAFKDAMLKCQPGDLMMVTVLRQGRFEYNEVSFEITLGTLE
ncbi:MAG: PDZ domain-containing protein [Lachnospiraceae bacterium]|nr:PDZ domain-containing protein [Lachnospiraceae bacterium]